MSPTLNGGLVSLSYESTVIMYTLDDLTYAITYPDLSAKLAILTS